MSDWLTQAQWSPYVVGAGIGILSWLTFLLSDRPIGCSTAFAQTAGLLEKWLRGSAVLQRAYYKRVVPKIDWSWMFVLGIAIGAFISAILSGTFGIQWVPELWQARFGPGVGLRLAAALVGGIFVGVGARWADGCTSGHGISGTLQLVVGSWLASICFFISGIIVAHLLF
ncbi:MAG: YeeE/YedE family protein [Chloroflexi bacterium]|nr:YeeE/YedE family protein [Chloroflexota bacterium]